MLVLGRKWNEQIVILVGDKTITLTVTKLEPGVVKLGFEAPKDVLVFRKEVYDLMQEEGYRYNPETCEIEPPENGEQNDQQTK